MAERPRVEEAGEDMAADIALVDALRRGDEAAFAALIDRYHPALVRMAMFFVRTLPAAEDVAQDTWLAVLRGLSGFDGRSSLKTWIFSILVNRARTHGKREDRYVLFSPDTEPDDDSDQPSVDPSRFNPDDHPQYPNGWVSFPRRWDEIPEQHLLSQETLSYIQQAIETLPPRQRAVIAFRDVEGWSAEEVRNVLDITETNQRVILHRARSKVRNALEKYFGE
jgi:RNA polymerase sigma-70 factor, ECF subfamily